MRVLSATLVVLFAFFFQVVRCGDNVHYGPRAKRHNSRVDVAATQQNITHLEKRVDGARFTLYDAGLGACGTVNTANDFIVALNAAQYDGGSHCYKTITITVNGKTTQALITDLCPGCPYGGLDFSRGLFNFFASESVGVLTGSWKFGEAAAPSSTPTPTPTPTHPPYTSIVTPTTTYTPPPTSTSTSSSVSTHSTSSTSTSVSIPTPTPLIPAPAAGNIADLFLIFVQVGSISVVGHGKI